MKKKLLALAVAFMMVGSAISTNAFAQTSADTYQVYTVRWGGTLKDVANIYKIDVNILEEHNPELADKSWLYSGQRVNIPKYIAETRPYTYQKYTVKYGGTLQAVANIYGINIDELKAYNADIADKSWLSKGTIVYIPDVARAEYIEKEVVRLVNIERKKVGLAPLELDPNLSRAARMKAEDMASTPYFSHTSPRYGSPFSLISAQGSKWQLAGENIASGYTTAEGVVEGWMNSTGHKRNILSSRYNKIGIGVASSYKKNGRMYWSQEFIQTWN
jgi:uncharacterized YkwD family protein